ncbi:hypothetical protein [Streptomyces sp. ICBB 8177]|uniref:hypothetical protein n=1 Tax=Streptomyces sp. ICBB 8177 TaxID=563922 RepID=UPI000D67F913|nr:hypothetical protein [Streptomyces sp. ICBB 8177]PWI41977.1 hypothetical protein CK485_24670 [Streptomyces sp. ICBB 8177]
MQPSAGPDLPHTRATAAHWLATGLGVAAAVAICVVAQPAGAAPTIAPATAPGAPNASAAHYPIACHGLPVDVVSKAAADLDGDGRPETVAVVRCDAPTGTPPSGVYVLDPPATPGGRPRVVGTLVDPANKLSLRDFTVTGRTVSATLLGYSSNQVPRCCPDLARKFSWEWNDGRYVAIPGPHANSV